MKIFKIIPELNVRVTLEESRIRPVLIKLALSQKECYILFYMLGSQLRQDPCRSARRILVKVREFRKKEIPIREKASYMQ